MRNFRTALLAGLAASFTLPLAAHTPEEALDSRYRAAEAWLDANLAKESVPGGAMGIVHDQDLIWSYQHGVESLETRRPVSNDTLFSICSVSKLFNGVAAMTLVDQDKIGLDAPLSDYDPDMRLPDNLGAEEAITTRNILSHVAGVPREGGNDYWADQSFPDVAGLHTILRSEEQLYKPYDHWQYSNLGMAMLGGVVGKVTGKEWGEYVRQAIFQPLGMERSTTDMPFDQVGKGFAQGYFVRNAKGERKPAPPHSFRSFAPAAGVASSVNDMAKFASWHFRLLENGGEEVLEATTLGQMLRVHWVGEEFDEPTWGLAYHAARYGDKTMWGHGGYCPGTRTEFVMRKPDKVGVVMMVTANDVSPGAMVKTVYSLTEGAITKVHGDKSDKKEAAKSEPAGKDLSEFEGYYAVANYDWDVYVGLNEDSLFSLPIYNSDPVSDMETWVHEEGDTFRRKRKDGSLAETVTFERDDAGKVVSLVQHTYRSTKR